MNRSREVAMVALLACCVICWGSVSSAWAGAGFNPIKVDTPADGTVLSNVGPGTQIAVAHAAAAKSHAAATADLTSGAVSHHGGWSQPELRAVTAEQAARIAQAEFDH
jgi:hypothetical protein